MGSANGERRGGGRSGADAALWAGFALGAAVLVAAAVFALTYRGASAGVATAPASGSPPVRSSSSGGPSACPSPADSVHVAAHNISFDAACLAAPAGRPFTIVFDNQDPGISHDVAIFTDPSASHALFTGAIITGPTMVTYHVGALPAGTYVFHCNVHPTQLHG